MVTIREVLYKYALFNAITYKGKAHPKSVLNKAFLELQGHDKKEIVAAAKTVIADVNKLSLTEQRKKLEKLAPELLEKQPKQTHDLFGFLNIGAKEKVTTAFPPEPSKHPHIGHVKAMLLNYELAKRHKGTFILRFEDTNPILAQKEFYDIYLERCKWLDIKPDKVIYVSDYMQTFYDMCQTLLQQEQAYVCTCSQTKVRTSRQKGTACKCRTTDVATNLKQWKQFFAMKEGTVIVRLKIDLEHKNTTMRDPTIMRIIDEPHPRTKKKYRVWPTYDFANAIMDGVTKVTHRLRSKEFELRNELQQYIQQLLQLPVTKIYEFARFNLKGVESSGRIIRDLIIKGKLTGWDDPSLTTLIALERRGFHPEPIKQFLLATGISKAEATLTWDDLILHNKRYLDKHAHRYFFIEQPKQIIIKNAPTMTVKAPLHPSLPKKGQRTFKTKDIFYIQDKLKKGTYYRFMHLFNFKDKTYVSKELDKKLHAKLIHWLPVNKDLVPVDVLMPDKTVRAGFAEPALKKVKEGTIVQFERFGFVRCDQIQKNKLVFYFTHA